MNDKLIKEYESLQVFDPISFDDKPNNDNKYLKGMLIFKDNKGNIIDIRENLILMQTRLHLFRGLFEGFKESNLPEDITYNNTLKRKICLFKIGQGGADVNGAPFNPYVPRFNDIDLAQPVPFKIVDINKDATYEGRSNPSIVTSLSTEDQNMLHLKEVAVDGVTRYYGKKFESNSIGWKVDESQGKVAYSLNINVTKEEARGFMINELGLVMCNEVYTDGVFTGYENPSLASRVTFLTRPLQDLSSTMDLEYIIYC